MAYQVTAAIHFSYLVEGKGCAPVEYAVPSIALGPIAAVTREFVGGRFTCREQRVREANLVARIGECRAANVVCRQRGRHRDRGNAFDIEHTRILYAIIWFFNIGISDLDGTRRRWEQVGVG